MAYASISTSMASPFQQMQRQAMEGLYGMGLTGEMDINEIRRKQREMEQFSRRAGRGQLGRMFGGSMFDAQASTSTFNDGSYSGSMGSPSMPYSSTMMGGSSMMGERPTSSFGGSSTGNPYSSTSNWSSMGAAPRFPYGGMMY